ncbi:Yet1p NDAI_0C00530 [Naumovozyma dairenensis CBS 421]|uniref:Endoplasmic reticulum transmembrane protein n=1 Tax=Naumovozyma dairenensis (strain ATCC 10597 / BCRC 20456 / CBS 421 / NBRC 0211 / NRRL Y-12639) TaxID=1071378 RepID=G0W7F3_NAUDC|nr:hypothetical protein NDAI_0C00530 [Naumovozyma dairenensis CBS 421]CCD23714.1 hypothetical protein NDAI_0C00530 [Naumovozyma dairenensis CBS 421]
MSLYFMALFGLLILEMSVLFISVLPLPNKIRKGIYKAYFKTTSSQESKTIIIILSVLVSLLFIDSWKRSQFRVTTYQSKQYQNVRRGGSGNEGIDDAPVTPLQALASRAYNQRNVYISGFILYFLVGIPTVMSIVRRLVKYDDLIKEQKKITEKTSIADDTKIGDTPSSKEIEGLENDLYEKMISLKGLQKQIKHLENYFDEMNKPLPIVKKEEVILKKDI